MPRKPSYPHVLRTVRALRELSQPALARLVGVEPITIRKIENGELKPSRKLANRLAIETGVDPNQIIENFDPQTPYPVMGHPEVLSKESWKTRREPKLDEPTLRAIEREVNATAIDLNEMLKASVPKGSVWVLVHALRQALAELKEEFGLPVKTDKFDPLKARAAATARKRERRSL
jgi:transcriptional regulator with XRE-family HTH domain